MARSLKIAAVQMDVSPAFLEERLARAEHWVCEAASAGAQLVVLPELFNTGYQYTRQNYDRAEPLDGPTATWMKQTASRLDIHLAGTLMLLDGSEIYNALLLFAPGGQMWRYDKQHPFAWERAYFRPGSSLTIANTSLGAVGFLICADTARPALWRGYAGQVDLMVICSSPPDFGSPVYTFPDGSQITVDQMGPLMQGMRDGIANTFCTYLPAQAAWLGVPAVNTVACGQFESGLPNAQKSLMGTAAAAPGLLRYLPQAKNLRVSANMVDATQVVDSNGQVLARRTQAEGEGFVLGEVTLPETRAIPQTPPPPAPVPAYGLAMVDLIAASCQPNYRAGLRRVHGKHMAPSPAIRKKQVAVLALAAGAVIAGIVRRRKKRR